MGTMVSPKKLLLRYLQGFGFRGKGLGFGMFRDLGFGIGIWDECLGFRVYGLGFNDFFGGGGWLALRGIERFMVSGLGVYRAWLKD